jgi:lipoprotein-anchoring transpeptidase ErfK/SrfK
MLNFNLQLKIAVIGFASLSLVSCAHYGTANTNTASVKSQNATHYADYSSRLPDTINANGRKTIVVDPRKHVWGAYDANGQLVKSGLATAGSNWCKDIGRPCRTSVGTFSIQSLGNASCKSTRYPKPRGGAPMPYCMFFNKNMALHGSNQVVEGNVSHGCVRLRVSDAEWLRHNFANVGTRVIVKPY